MNKLHIDYWGLATLQGQKNGTDKIWIVSFVIQNKNEQITQFANIHRIRFSSLVE